MPTIEELEVQIKDLTGGKSPGSYEPSFFNAISHAGWQRDEVTAHLRQWLIAKGVPPTKAYGASTDVLNRAYGIGDRYINAMIRGDYDKKPLLRNRERPINVDLSPKMFDAEIVDLLNDGPKQESPEPENPIIIDAFKRATTTKVQIDADQIARAADAVIRPRLDRAQKALESQFDTATRLVDNKITVGINTMKGQIEDAVHLAIEAKGIGDNLTDEIKQLVDTTTKDFLERMTPRKLEIKVGNVVRQLEAEPRHKKFDEILTWLLSGSHVYIVGPKGTGKTHLGKQLAQALGREFYPIDQSLTKYDVKGYKGPTGEYIATLVRTCVEHGGLLFIDEGDMWASAALGSLNSILANDFGAFPDGVVKVHSDFICVVCANTYGHGADRQYNGRNPLDAASLDRFSFVEVDYDEDLEIQLYGNGPWVQYVHRMRVACRTLKYDDMIPSMRAIVAGLQGLNAGLSVESVAFARLWKGAAKDKIDKILAQTGNLPQPKVEHIAPEPHGKLKTLRDLVVGNMIVAAIGCYREIIEDRDGEKPGLLAAKIAVERYRDGLVTLEELFA